MPKPSQPDEATFLRDVAQHHLHIDREAGIYRHLRFQQPESNVMRFDIVTWPGYLAYTGDMGTYVFSRVPDMLTFFRGDAQGPLRINLSYWPEKLEAHFDDGEDRHARVFCPDTFKAAILEWLDDDSATDDVRQEVSERVLCYAHDGEDAAMRAALDFEHDGFGFQDFWEVSCRKHSYRFVWCCYALVWGIRQYDAVAERRKRLRGVHFHA